MLGHEQRLDFISTDLRSFDGGKKPSTPENIFADEKVSADEKRPSLTADRNRPNFFSVSKAFSASEAFVVKVRSILK
jgi:hypothetical protein